MDYKIYRFRFQTAVHFGKQNLDEGGYSFCADTLFSALCQEAVRMGEETLQRLVAYAKDGKLLLSDAFPYIGETYFLPKPIKRIETTDKTGDSVLKKAYKKLKYIPMDMLDIYLKGQYDVLNAPDFDNFGYFEMKDAVSIRGEAETQPYRVGTYFYHPGSGLYIILGYQEPQALELAEQLLEGLSFSGIGGKRASGFGRFTLYPGKLSPDFRRRLTGDGSCYLSLSVALPQDDELETALDGAQYLLCKRSGFVASEHYAPEQMRKKDLYVFQAGSCFLSKFCGDVYNVLGKGGRHPVYRYAKPMFMEGDI